VALQPRIAFIVDIRRQNMLQHLLYKALMEQSADRAEFLSRLFSRPRPAALDRGATAAALFQAYDSVPADSMLFRKNLAAVTDHLVKRHKFDLSAEDLKSIEYVYSAFYAGGPDLTYSSFPGYTAVRTTGPDSVMQELRSRTGGAVTVFRMQGGMRRMPTYAELMMETDQQGEQRSYLATEEHYARLREMQKNNLIVPLVGDFGGDKALQAVGSYLRARRATVTAFYTSNVEQYLFQQPDSWRNFFANVSTLPIDDGSLFIRAVFNGIAWRDQSVARTPGPRSVTMLSSISEILKAVNDGRVQTYYDVIQLSR
jgi:hypothetical protein